MHSMVFGVGVRCCFCMIVVVSIIQAAVSASSVGIPTTCMNRSTATQKESIVWLATKRSFVYKRTRISNLIHVRGGSDENEYEYDGEEKGEEDEYDNESEGEEESLSSAVGESALALTLKLMKRSVKLLGKISILTFQRIQYAANSAIEKDEVEVEDEEEESSISSMLWTTSKKFACALLQGPDSVAVTESSSISQKIDDLTISVANKSTKRKQSSDSYTQYLKNSFQVCVTTKIMNGSLSDSLKACRGQAKLMIAYIPSKRVGKAKSSDGQAAISLCSEEVEEVVSEYKGGSFERWGCVGGTSESSLVAKRMRASQRKNIPTLAVVYPAQVIDPSSGRPKLVPKLLAQHHCSPPPDPQAMASWLKALRKRHSKLIKKMKQDIKEQELYLERKQGYRESAKNDREREEIEKKLEIERKRAEEAERLRNEELEERRHKFLEELPVEPPKGSSNVFTIALRFADGRNAKRRFNGDDEMEFLFNWIDAEFSIEREKVELATMNGSKTFTFNIFGDTAIKDSGIGKMTGLRVSEINSDEKEDKSEEGI